jgi:hypothetical protein
VLFIRIPVAQTGFKHCRSEGIEEKQNSVSVCAVSVVYSTQRQIKTKKKTIITILFYFSMTIHLPERGAVLRPEKTER